jgi:PIN domain nuclease of toxin-antitoxin system
MRLLLDTDILLWSLLAEDHKLNSRATALWSSKDSTFYLSAAAVWEIAIKYDLGTLRLHWAPDDLTPGILRRTNMRPLNITSVHAIEAGRLPRYHNVPFDRMLIAQAQTEGLVLLTADRVFKKYGVDQILCGR